ncbi:carbamoyltransferase HypF [Candidatus Bathyarchaeota archaeon]|nr:MAG: carbamoyltransferase HypF [Candidatus Bathyarchaeota archaeon]
MPLQESGRLEAELHITGRVQGVGFRPFIYRKAVKNGLTGHVINLGDAGVEVVVEGTPSQIEAFIREVEEDAPAVSEIEEIHVVYQPYRGRFKEFKIDRSQSRGRAASGIFPPDIGICADCVKDMGDPESRWFEYPFTACAWCGPRFTAIRSLPYDRERTHMDAFPMCRYCEAEYRDPMDRRFDAQGITCSLCGPKMTLYDAAGSEMRVDDVFEAAAELLRAGHVVAVKGIGGVHLAALATDDDVVQKLRERKNRPYQPFALMSPDLKAVRSYASPTREEETVLESWQRPIVLVKKKRGGALSGLIAPGLDRVGVMLPYTGIHLMLFRRLGLPALIMTSGNKPGLPMAITNESALSELSGIADYFLLHNREIINRCDDSVLRIIRGHKTFLRRSRGYVPDPIDVPLKRGLSIAVGAELRNAGAITHNGKSFMTQYLGDITNIESLEFERNALDVFKRLLNITRNPDVIGCDLHPGYMTSHLAAEISQETGAPLVKSQHHHAHITAVAAEHKIPPDEPIIGIALDGVGYGTDGAIWGGEVLKSTYSEFERVGHLEYLPMPGGDLCTYYPLRMLISALTPTASDEEICDITENHIKKGLPHGETELRLILRQARDSRVIRTSSSGRFLDAIAALTGLCYRRTYEGEPAIRVEAAAARGRPDHLNMDPEIEVKNGVYILKTSEFLYNLAGLMNKMKVCDLAAFGQRYLALGVAEMALAAASESDIKTVALSGGVFVNEYITNEIIDRISEQGLNVLYHKFVPPGDGGIAPGQSLVALSHVM